MKNFGFIFLILGMLVFWSENLSAQSVISSSGASSSNAEGSLSWTLGELAISTYSSGDLILTQGFHQTNLVISSIETSKFEPNIKVFPNPSPDLVNIDLKDIPTPSDYKLFVFDQEGGILINEKISSNNQVISLGSFPAAVYYIRIEGKSGDSKVFRIVKK